MKPLSNLIGLTKIMCDKGNYDLSMDIGIERKQSYNLKKNEAELACEK